MRVGLGIAGVEPPEYCADPSYAEMYPECSGVAPAHTGGPDIYIPGVDTAHKILLRLSLTPNAPVPTNIPLQPTGYPTPTPTTNYTPYIIGGAVLLLLVMMGRR